MACLLVVGLLFTQACAGFTPFKTVCANQETATMVKEKAKVAMQNAKLVIDALTAELGIATNVAVIATLTAGIAIANTVLNAAYHLVYEVACPELEAMGVLDTQVEVMNAMHVKAMKMARAAR